MADNSKIEWTDHTFNPWEGCQKVGPGCDNCYAEARNARFGGGKAINWGPGAPRRRTSEANWRKPLKWNSEGEAFAAKHGRKQRVFCASLADVFDNAVDRRWRADLFGLIDKTPNLDWLLLTKRIGNVSTMLAYENRERLPENVWLGATVVNQDEADRDIPKLLDAPARVRFLSIEPMLGPIDLSGIKFVEKITGEKIFRQYDSCLQRSDGPVVDWVIVGGESGFNARILDPHWVEMVYAHCARAGTAFLFKQWGEFLPDRLGLEQARSMSFPAGHVIYNRVGKKVAGRQLYGVTHDGFPS